MVTYIEQIRRIIRTAGVYEGNKYTDVMNINSVNEILPKFHLKPIQKYDNSNTEQVKYFELTIECNSENEKETIQTNILNLTSDNVVTGYNKSNNLDFEFDIKSADDDYGLLADDTQLTGDYSYVSINQASLSFFRFNLKNLIDAGATINDAYLYFTAYNNTGALNQNYIDQYVVGIDSVNTPAPITYTSTDDFDTLATQFNRPYFNDDSGFTSMTAGTEYYVHSESVSDTDELKDVIQSIVDISSWEGKNITLLTFAGTTTDDIRVFTRDSSNSNSGKYARLVISISPDSDYPFYINITQIPIEDYNLNNYKCRFEIEARWAI